MNLNNPEAAEVSGPNLRFDKDELAALRVENAALKAEIVAIHAEIDLSALENVRDKAIQSAVTQEVLRREGELAILTAQLEALIRSSSEVRYILNADWSELAELSGGGFLPDTSSGNRNWLEEYIPEEHRDLVRGEIARAIAAKDTYNIEHKVNQLDGSVGWALSRAVPLFDERGEITSWMGAASDITHRKTAEEAQRMLNDELAHRMKNAFTMVQAIISQTLRQASNIDDGREAVSGRIHALARAQDALTGARFTAAEIHTLVDGALGPHQGATKRISTQGPAINLPPQRALGLSLALHELATNATKYGALSTDQGSVAVSWCLENEAFAFSWIEKDGPRVEKPTRRSFGSTLIEDIVGSYFDGIGKITFDPDGVKFHMTGTVSSLDYAEPF